MNYIINESRSENKKKNKRKLGKKKMKKGNTKKQNDKKEIFYYIIYEYDKNKNDIQYITSKNNLIDSINCINNLLLSNGDNINTIKNIESIIKNRNIAKYITLDIENIKLINNYIIFKQFLNEKINKKYILSEIEKQAIKNDDIIINKVYKNEVIKYRYKKHIKTLDSKIITKKLDKKDAFKKFMEIKQKINNNFNRLHENKNILIGGGLYE